MCFTVHLTSSLSYFAADLAQSDRPSQTLTVKDMDKHIIELLRKEGRPRSALQISKGVGKFSAKDVNPTLYRLEKEGCVQRMGKFRDGPAPLWGLVHGGSFHGNRG